MAQRSSPILPLTSGIGTVSPVNVGGPGSAEEAFRNQQGVLQRLLSGLGGGNNVSLEDLARSQFRDRQDLATGLESAGSSRFSPGQSIDITGQSNQILPPGFSSTDLTPIPGSIGMSEVPVTGAPDLSTAQSGLRRGPLGLDMTAIDDNPFSISAPMPSDEANRLASLFGITPKGQQSFSDLISGIGRIIAPRETPRERKERAAKGEEFKRSEDAIGGTLFGDAVNVTPAQAQETAGILTKLIQDSATRGGAEAAGERAETAVTDGEKSSTTVQGDVTDITDQPDDLVETDPRFGAETAPTTRSFGPDEQTTESNIYSDLMKTSTNSVLEALGKAPEGAKSIDDYKKIFSDATGIDISGQPDNSAALTAFGLALMQNKAGKGFNVGKILSETGAAGEKALPLMVQAKKDAKASQLAAGQFALTQQSKDAATRTAFITDQVNYLRDRRDKINDDMVARINATEDIRLKAKLKAEGDYQNHLYNRQIKLLELNNKAAKGQFKTGDKTTFKPITGMDNLTLTMGVRESDGQPVYKFPAEEASRFGVALADVNDGLRSLDEMSSLISDVANATGGITGGLAMERLNSWSRSIGFKNIFEDPDGGSATKLADADAIKKRVIAQYKRFLSQETGNGISEGDVTRLENALGDIRMFENPDVALRRIEETRAIFMGRKSQLVNEIEGFDDRDLYLSEKQYEKTMRGLAADIDAAYYYDKGGDQGDRSTMMSEIFDITEDADGMQTYRLKSS